MDAGKYAALDYETLYSTKDGYTLTNMTAYQYVHDPRFNPYLLAVCYGDGRPDYVGSPEGFDWESLRGLTCLAHNAGFDSMVTARLRELGKVPADIALDWLDTADLTAYLGVQRNLKSACKYLLGREISKQVRSDMDGKLPCNLNSQELRDLYEYGASDARECLEIFLKYGDRWPEVERAISNQNRIACQDGFHVDRDSVVKGIEILRKVQDRAAEKLPWVNCEDPSQRRPAGSIQALAEEVRRAGVTPPSSFKKDDPGFLEWNEKYADQFPFIKARLEHAGTVQHIARLETLLAQLDSNDLVRPGLVYFGAHSGRFTAGVGAEQKGAKNVNMLNLPRKPVYGVDMRGMYIPRDGYRFVIFDYSQIEARALLWLAGDHETCNLLTKPGMNLYGIAATKMGWCKLEDDIKHNNPELYRLAKCCLTGDTLVLTRTMRRDGALTSPRYKTILDVTTMDFVWDGHEWVRHLGVKKMKEVARDKIIDIDGTRLTGDHHVYTGEYDNRRADGLSGTDIAAAEAWWETCHPVQGWAHVRILASALLGACAYAVRVFARETLHVLARKVCMHGLRDGVPSAVGQREERRDDPMQSLCEKESKKNVRAARVGEGA